MLSAQSIRAFRYFAVAVAVCAVSGCAVSGCGTGDPTADRLPVPTSPALTNTGRAPVPPAAPSPIRTRRDAPPAPRSPGVVLPVPNANFDYQLGGAYPPQNGVTMVSRDRTDPPVAGVYNVCYVNGFQTQPGERAWWLTNHPTLILRNASGNPVIDPSWPDEYIFDVSTAAKRNAIATIIGPWIIGCRVSGFQSVEIDNLDTYTRFSSLSEADAIAMIELFVSIAHGNGLAIAQKNSPDLVGKRTSIGLDFAVAEQCGEFNECDRYTSGYSDLVYVIEYNRAAFTRSCRDFPSLSVVLRDVQLSTPTNPAYVRDTC